MLQKPDLSDETIIACMRADYGVRVTDLAFLPLGADVNTAVYRVADDGTSYFLKLRRGPVAEASVVIPRLLADHGIAQLIAPLPTRAGRLWTRLADFTSTLSPFVAGRNGFEARLSDHHWVELGAALRGLHTLDVPLALREGISYETFSPVWRDMVRLFQAQVEETTFGEPVAVQVAAFMRSQRTVIDLLVASTERLAQVLQARAPDFVLCHGDIHAANLLLSDDEALYIVDWDTLIFAPGERDLMFVGAGLGIADTPDQAALFYQGYGPAAVDPLGIAYYRCGRVIEDIAAFCQQLLLTDEGGADREQALGYLVDSFLPHHVVDIALSDVKRIDSDFFLEE